MENIKCRWKTLVIFLWSFCGYWERYHFWNHIFWMCKTPNKKRRMSIFMDRKAWPYKVINSAWFISLQNSLPQNPNWLLKTWKAVINSERVHFGALPAAPWTDVLSVNPDPSPNCLSLSVRWGWWRNSLFFKVDLNTCGMLCFTHRRHMLTPLPPTSEGTFPSLESTRHPVMDPPYRMMTFKAGCGRMQLQPGSLGTHALDPWTNI